MPENKDVLRRFVPAEGFADPDAEILVGWSALALCELDEGAYDLAVFVVGDGDYRGELDGVVGG